MNATWRGFVCSAFLFCASAYRADAADFFIARDRCAAERVFAAETAKRLDSDVLRKFHDVLMDNELSGGCGALQFTDAKMDSHTNGFSFGLSQFDLATRPSSVRVLKRMISCARDEGIHEITDADVKFLEENGPTATFVLQQNPETWSKFLLLRQPIESVLRSNCGKRMIADSYIAEMREFEKQVEPLWQAVLKHNPSQKPAEMFYKLYALDLLNVLGGAEGFRKIVNREAKFVCFTLCAQKLTEVYVLDGPVSTADFIRYPFQTTCYGFIPAQTRQQDALRRLNRVLASIDLSTLALDEDDTRYLKTEFARIVGQNLLKFPNAKNAQLMLLIAKANGGENVKDFGSALDGAVIAKAGTACTPKV